MADTDSKPDTEPAEAAEPKRFESETETVGPCKVEVRITIPATTVREELDERFAEIIRTVAFPGFRIGHAPRRLVEKKLGTEVADEVKENLIADSFKDAIETHRHHGADTVREALLFVLNDLTGQTFGDGDDVRRAWRVFAQYRQMGLVPRRQ